MANRKHLEILEQGVEIWNEWRNENPSIRPNLRGAELIGQEFEDIDFSRADLREADLSMTSLSGANLSQARLHKADLFATDFSMADLSNAILCEADLLRADCTRTNLNKANLSRTRLVWVNFNGANVSGANFSQAEMGATVFADLDLSGVKGLGTVIHKGPSTIGIDSIYLSHGKIPLAFLFDAGVPDAFITYAASLTGEASKYYSCFISYSHEDEAFAQQLHADLQDKGVRCWFAPEDIAGGKKIYEQIDRAIHLYDKTLLVLSEHSIGSQWVMTEIRRTRKVEFKEYQRKLFPIRLVDMDTLKAWECFDADTGKDLAVEVREYHIPDFSTWKNHDTYQRAFDRLLRDLKAEEG
jgi:hypothetical protein